MKTLKFRYAAICSYNSEPELYYIQKKTWFGWRYIRYENCSDAGCVMWKYYNTNKDVLLDKVLDEKYHTTRKYIKLIEFPMIKIIH